VHGARAVAEWRRRTVAHPSPWLSGLLARRPMNVATVAPANKDARVARALLTRGDVYRREGMARARAACAA
jgi:transposase